MQKGGKAPVVDVLDYGDTISKSGLNLLNGPGNDMVAVTNLTAAGCHLILFTTGRGTPFGGFIPTVKVATNTLMATRKSNWIDFNAGALLEGKKMSELTDEFLDYVLKLASGEIKAKAEALDKHELAIFKDGVTL